MNHYIYLAPHLDDVSLSCGGLAWEQVHRGDRVEVWTICAGIPDEMRLPHFARQLHRRWETAEATVVMRRAEDRAACYRLGVGQRHFDWYDCIYRYKLDGTPFIQLNGELFRVQPEPEVVAEVTAMLVKETPPGATLVSPLTVGNHVDHILVRSAAERSGLPLLYYADYPYLLDSQEFHAKVAAGELLRQNAPISVEAVTAWHEAVWMYPSQVSTFWRGRPAVALAYRNYWAGGGGRLWELAHS